MKKMPRIPDIDNIDARSFIKKDGTIDIDKALTTAFSGKICIIPEYK